MKKIQIISFLLFTSILFSCTYDYIMPDYSNAKPQYVLQELPNEVKNEWRNIAIGYGLNLNISQEKWEAAAKENKENQSLEIAVRCLGRYNSFNDEYYEICRFRLTDRNVRISPFPYVIKVNPNENYITELPPVTERAYIYKIMDSDIRFLILKIAKSIGYEIADINRSVIEKDKDGNILYQGENSEYHISAKGTQTVEIFFDLIGWPKGNYSKKVKIGTLKIDRVFDLTNIADKDYINKEILLSKDIPYTLDLLSDSERIYNYKVTYGQDITSLMTKTAESLGYDIAGSKILITEKDEIGNIINQKYKPNGDELIYSTKGAVTVEFAIEIEGWPKGSYNNKSIVCTLIFEEKFDLKAINNQTVTLTANMPYTISKEKR